MLLAEVEVAAEGEAELKREVDEWRLSTISQDFRIANLDPPPITDAAMEYPIPHAQSEAVTDIIKRKCASILPLLE